MKKYSLSLVVFALFGLGVFSYGKVARAYDVIVDTTANTQLSNGYSQYISSTELDNPDGVSNLVDTTNTDIIKDVRLWVYIDPTFRSNYATSTIRAYIITGSGTQDSTYQNITNIPILGGLVDFDFSSNTTVSANTGIQNIGIETNPSLGATNANLGFSNNTAISGYAGNQTPQISNCKDYLTGGICAGKEAIYAMYGAGGEPPLGNVLQVEFQNPPFLAGRTGPDFRNWQVCNTIPNTSGISGYYDTITYGTSTPYGVATDSLLTTIGIIPLNAPLINNCPIITKTATSSPGSYQAEITLYNQSGVALATSTVLDYTIVGTGLVDYVAIPGISTSTPPIICGATSFQVFGADVGQGICNATSYLFLPNISQLQSWTQTQTLMQSKAPFSYFYDLTNALTTLPTSTSATITPLTLSVGSTSTPIHLNWDMFSANTIDKYTNSTSRGLLRTVIQYSLYLAFLAMVILEVRKLFSKPKQ